MVMCFADSWRIFKMIPTYKLINFWQNIWQVLGEIFADAYYPRNLNDDVIISLQCKLLKFIREDFV